MTPLDQILDEIERLDKEAKERAANSVSTTNPYREAENFYRNHTPQLAKLVRKYREALEFYAKRLDKGMSIPDEEDFPEYGNLARAALDWSPEDE